MSVFHPFGGLPRQRRPLQYLIIFVIAVGAVEKVENVCDACRTKDFHRGKNSG